MEEPLQPTEYALPARTEVRSVAGLEQQRSARLFESMLTSPVARLKSRGERQRKRFMALVSLDEVTKKALRSPFIKGELICAEGELWANDFGTVVAALLILAAFPLVALSSSLLASFSPVLAEVLPLSSLNDASWRTIAAVPVGLVALIAPPYLSKLFSSRRVSKFLAHPKFFLVWFWSVFFGLWAFVYRFLIGGGPVDAFYTQIALGLFILLAFLSFCFLLLVPLVMIVGILRRRPRKRQPQAAVAHELFEILSMLESYPKKWSEIEFRRQIIVKLESVARCLEREFPRSLRSGALDTDVWVQDQWQQVAAGVRSLIKGLVTPKHDTYQWLRARVASDLVAALNANWDNFERVKPEKLSRPERLLGRLARFAKATVLAAVPLGTLMIFKWFKLVPDPTISTYLSVGGYLWAALTLLSGLDPNYGAKLNAIKDIAGFIPLPGKSK